MTTEIMKDPVVTHDGQVYERSAVNEWFRNRRSQRPPVPITSPSTGLAFPSLALTPEEPLRRAIEEYVAARPELARRELDLISLQWRLSSKTSEIVETPAPQAKPPSLEG